MIVSKSKPEVSICKVVLWKQLNSNADLNHLVNEEVQIKSRLVDAFDRRVSTSILVVGPTGSGKRELVEKVMIDYCTDGLHNSRPVSVARINGLVHLNDNQVREFFIFSFVSKSNLSRTLSKFFILEYDVDLTGYNKSSRSTASSPKLL